MRLKVKGLTIKMVLLSTKSSKPLKILQKTNQGPGLEIEVIIQLRDAWKPNKPKMNMTLTAFLTILPIKNFSNSWLKDNKNKF